MSSIMSDQKASTHWPILLLSVSSEINGVNLLVWGVIIDVRIHLAIASQ